MLQFVNMVHFDFTLGLRAPRLQKDGWTALEGSQGAFGVHGHGSRSECKLKWPSVDVVPMIGENRQLVTE